MHDNLDLPLLWGNQEYFKIINNVKNNNDVESYDWHFRSLMRLGRFDEALDILSVNKKIFFRDNFWSATYFLNLGNYYWSLGELENSRETYFEGLKIAESNKDSIIYPQILSRIGVIFDNMGKFHKAIEYGNLALGLYREMNDHEGIIYSNYVLGYIHQVRGEVEKALRCYDEGIELAKKYSNKKYLGAILRNKSKTMFDKGESSKAIDIIQQSINIFENLNRSDWELTHSYQRIIEYLCSVDDLNLAESYLTKLETLNKESTLTRLDHIMLYSKALFLKSHKKIQFKAESETMFREFLALPNIRQELTVSAYGHLVQLLLREFIGYQNQEVLEEIGSIITFLKDYSTKELLYNTLFLVFQVESDIYALNGEFEKALSMIDDAKKIAFENQLHSAFPELNKQQERFKNEFLRLKEIVARLSRYETFSEKVTNYDPDSYIDFFETAIDPISKIKSDLSLELYKYRFLLNPVRLSIIRSLFEYPTLNTVELKNSLNLNWSLFSTHLEALKKRDYIYVERLLIDGNLQFMISLQPKSYQEFRNLISLLYSFLQTISTGTN